MSPLDPILQVFTGWKPHAESLQSSGQNVTEGLRAAIVAASSMSAQDLTFTACDPLHKGRSLQYVLGTIEGNEAFLNGRINPGFRVTSDHFLVLNPTLSKAEAEDWHAKIVHPANPSLWALTGLKCLPEGPPQGLPHPRAALMVAKATSDKDAIANGVKFESFGYAYLGVPDQQWVYDLTSKYPISWELFQHSYLASAEPDLAATMDAATDEEEEPLDVETVEKHAFDDAVYSLVKSTYPLPGASVPFELDTGEVANALVGTASIRFTNREGASVKLSYLGNELSEVSLVDGDNPAAVFAVTKAILGINTDTAMAMTDVLSDMASKSTDCDLEDDFSNLSDTDSLS